jgi:hypothetical protein
MLLSISYKLRAPDNVGGTYGTFKLLSILENPVGTD